MPSPRGLRPPVIKASLAIACAAWLLLIVGMYRVERGAALVVAVAWPVFYGIVLGVIWVFAKFAASMDESALYGSRKDLQMKALPYFLLWINAVVVLVPSAVLLIALAGSLGMLPVKHAP